MLAKCYVFSPLQPEKVTAIFQMSIFLSDQKEFGILIFVAHSIDWWKPLNNDLQFISKSYFRSAGSLLKAKENIGRKVLEENMDKFDGASRMNKKTTNILERPLNKGRNEVNVFF